MKVKEELNEFTQLVQTSRSLSLFSRGAQKITNALKDTWHVSCFTCVACQQPIGGNAFHMEDGQPYCEQGVRESVSVTMLSYQYHVHSTGFSLFSFHARLHEKLCKKVPDLACV